MDYTSTQSAAARDVISATAALVAAGGSARPSASDGAAASRLAKEDHLTWTKDYPHPEFETTQRAGFARYAARHYAEREPPCDPSAAAGGLGHARTMTVVADDGTVRAATRVASGLDLGHAAPHFVTESMRQTGTADVKLTKMGGWTRHVHTLAPRPYQKFFKGDHKALSGPVSP
jgi:hypothetical protein